MHQKMLEYTSEDNRTFITIFSVYTSKVIEQANSNNSW